MTRRHRKVASGLRHQREKALHHSAVWISERIEHREVIGLGDLLVTSCNASLAPHICHKPTLAQEFIRLARTDHSIEYEAAWCRPRHRRILSRSLFVETKILIH